jgi:hypothetical protein
MERPKLEAAKLEAAKLWATNNTGLQAAGPYRFKL